MRIGVAVLCRYNSSRFPGKILRLVRGRTVLEIIVERIRVGVPGIPIVVATSTDPSDDVVETYCLRSGFRCYRGELENVAARLEACAREHQWDYVVRINGDNLFVDPGILSAMTAIARTGSYDFVTNVPGRTFPYGMSVEILRSRFYSELRNSFTEPSHNEHVTSWLYDHPGHGNRFTLQNRAVPAARGLQLAIDTPDDLARAETILRKAGERGVPARFLDMATISEIAEHTEHPVPSPWVGASGPLLIAEIGGNHEGDFEYAKELTHEALRSGADCIKFQAYTGDALVSSVESPARNAHFKKFELDLDQHVELAAMCVKGGATYLSSVWDTASLDYLDPHLAFYKIGSGDMTAWPILRAHADRKKPILLSTGLSTLDEVAQTVRFLQRLDPLYDRPEGLCVLQCTSMYPIQDQEAELRVLDVFRRELGVAVGYSDHTIGSRALLAAAAAGAQVLEFHFTDSRDGKTFRDHQVSLTADEVIRLRNEISAITTLRGSGLKQPQPSEIESGHVESFRRAIYACREIPSGSEIKAQDLAVLRPAHGTDARDWNLVVGSKSLTKIEPFHAIKRGVHFA